MIEDTQEEIEILFDVVGVSLEQQKIIDIIAKILAGGFILWQGKQELFKELSRYKPRDKNKAFAFITQ